MNTGSRPPKKYEKSRQTNTQTEPILRLDASLANSNCYVVVSGTKKFQ